MVKKSVAASLAAMFALTLLGSSVLAQVATPVADCAATSPDENILIVTGYLAAVTSGDAAGADALLHDDAIHDLSLEGAEVPNEPGNADELSEDNLAAAAEANLVVDTTVASDDWVAVEFSFDVSGEAIEGADPTQTAHVEAMAFARIECGMIAEAHFEFDALGLLQQLGYDLATPAP